MLIFAGIPALHIGHEVNRFTREPNVDEHIVVIDGAGSWNGVPAQYLFVVKRGPILIGSENLCGFLHASEFGNFVKHPGENHLTVESEVFEVIIVGIEFFLDGLTSPGGGATLCVNGFVKNGEDGIGVETEAGMHALEKGVTDHLFGSRMNKGLLKQVVDVVVVGHAPGCLRVSLTAAVVISGHKDPVTGRARSEPPDKRLKLLLGAASGDVSCVNEKVARRHA